MSQSVEHNSSAGHGLSHIVPMRVLLGVFVALMVLTVVTVGAAYVNLGNLNLYAALAIAGVKGTLVVLYFMHLRYDRPFNLVVFVGCLFFVVLFISGVLTDTRAYAPSVHPGGAPSVQHRPLGSP